MTWRARWCGEAHAPASGAVLQIGLSDRNLVRAPLTEMARVLVSARVNASSQPPKSLIELGVEYDHHDGKGLAWGQGQCGGWEV